MKSFIYIPMLFTTIAAFLFPIFLRDGYLGLSDRELIYPTIASFVAIFGGMIASYWWWYKEVWLKRK
jgi:hypothetical protein